MKSRLPPETSTREGEGLKMKDYALRGGISTV